MEMKRTLSVIPLLLALACTRMASDTSRPVEVAVCAAQDETKNHVLPADGLSVVWDTSDQLALWA